MFLLNTNWKILFITLDITGDLETCLSQLARSALLSTNASILVLEWVSRFSKVRKSARDSFTTMGSLPSVVSQ